MEQSPEKFDAWGIVEMMGHKRFAGRITEQTIAGAALVRVDVPAVITNGDQHNAFSKLIGVGSIYCITPTTEEVARKAAMVLAREGGALPVYIPEDRQIPATSSASHAPEYEDEDQEELTWSSGDEGEG